MLFFWMLLPPVRLLLPLVLPLLPLVWSLLPRVSCVASWYQLLSHFAFFCGHQSMLAPFLAAFFFTTKSSVASWYQILSPSNPSLFTALSRCWGRRTLGASLGGSRGGLGRLRGGLGALWWGLGGVLGGLGMVRGGREEVLDDLGAI